MEQMAVAAGALWFRLDRRHRMVAYDNMRHAIGNEVPNRAIQSLLKANFIQLARMALALPSLLKFNAGTANKYVTITGQAHLEKARSQGKGILLLTGHLGHWELMALAAPILLDLPIGVVARKLDYLPLEKLLRDIRTRTGNHVIDKTTSGEEIGRLLKKGGTVGILLDQNSNYHEGVYVPFFGRIACTNKGLAILALRYGATVLPAFNIRGRDGRYHIMIGPPLSVKRASNLQRDIILLTKRFNEVIESYIRKAPDNWLWVHRRWRLKKIPESARKKVSRLALAPLPPEIWIPGR